MVLDNLDDLESELEDTSLEIAGRRVSLSDVEKAHGALESARSVAAAVTPGRVIIATGLILLLFLSSFGVWYFLVPRDAVAVEVVYMQGGPGHVVLAEVHNFGSREVTDLSVDMQFETLEGELLASSSFDVANLPGHVSIAGDDLELTVAGASVWENYSLSITVEYTNHRGDVVEKVWLHTVGEWAFESFRDNSDVHWF